MKTEARLSLTYFLVGFAWIVITDLVTVPLLALSTDELQRLGTYKGWFYVGVSTLALYITLRREFNRRRAAEAKELESRRLTERIISTVPEAIQIIDLNNRTTELVNRTARQVFGGGDMHMDKGAFGDSIHPDDVARFPEFLEQAMKLDDGEILETEYRIRDTGGNWRTMYERSTMFSRNADGSLAQMLAIVRDVTERKIAEEQVMFQANVLQNVSDAIISVDASYCVTSWNPAAEKIYGYTVDEVLGIPLRDLIKTEYVGVTREQAMGEVLSLGFWRGEVVQRRKDGTRVDALNASTLLKDRHGGTIGIVAINRDMTEQNRLQAEARKNELLRVDLEREMAARMLRSRFMTTVSHEFRTPLTTIQLAAELLEHYFDRMKEAGRTERLVQIKVEVKRLLTMLDEILLVLKTETTGEYFNPAPMDVAAMIREVVWEFGLLSENPARLTLHMNVEAAVVEADGKILRPALVNMLSNAIKYSPDSTSVDVRLVQNGMRLSVSVVDQGIGIPQDDLKHLTQAFYRGTNAANIPGTGLGLLITRQAAEIHGGSLEVRSELGKGTTVTIHLPTSLNHSHSSVPHA